MPANVKRLNGIFPEVGTIVGPDWAGGYWRTEAVDEKGIDLLPAKYSAFAEIPDEPRSVAEHNLLVRQRQLVVAKELLRNVIR